MISARKKQKEIIITTSKRRRREKEAGIMIASLLGIADEGWGSTWAVVGDGELFVGNIRSQLGLKKSSSGDFDSRTARHNRRCGFMF